MFTKKSLIPGAALVLAMACTGIVAASAHTATTEEKYGVMTPYQQGIPAISPARGKGLLSLLDVAHYLKSHGFVAGSTPNGKTPFIQNLHLTNVANLKSLEHLFIPWLPANKKVYFAKLHGPFTLIRHIAFPPLSITIPSAENLPVLGRLLPSIGNVTNSGFLQGSLQDLASIVNNLSNLSNWPDSTKIIRPNPGTPRNGAPQTTGTPGNGVPQTAGTLGNSPPKVLGHLNILQSVYEVFDAHNGNLLAWG